LTVSAPAVVFIFIFVVFILFQVIRGPTHVTQTDVWVSRGDTLSLSKRRGGLIGNCCTASGSKIACRHHHDLGTGDWVMTCPDDCPRNAWLLAAASPSQESAERSGKRGFAGGSPRLPRGGE